MTPVWAQSAIDITPRGYTGHEHVDEMGIIHMNGRIYDALLGRFLQADPFVEDSTTLNRYAYVHNNPLSLTDPSGFFSFKKFFKLAAVVAISVYTGGLANAALAAGNFAQVLTYAVLGGALAGGIAAGSIEGALWGAFSGAVFFGIGQHFAGSLGEGQGVFGSTFKSGELVRASVAHGLAGGTISEMQGGKFGHGFLSAGISKAATPMAVGVSDQVYIQGAAVAIVGGTTSEISGGKFANGATTAAIAFAFNQLPSQRSESPIERRIGTAENFVEIADEDALMSFKGLGVGDQRIAALSAMQPFDQIIIDLAVEGLAAAVVGDAMLEELMQNVGEVATVPVRAPSPRFILHRAALDERFDPARLQNAIDSRLNGIGQGPRMAAGVRIVRRLDCKLQGC